MGAAHRLDFDHAFPYVASESDFRLLPRLPLYVVHKSGSSSPIRLQPLLDTGADCTAFDSSVAIALGWPAEDIERRALDARPIYGLGTSGPPLTGYLHHLRCLVPAGHMYADFILPVLLTAPGVLATPVLGRHDFFRLVDFALVEAEQRFFVRFRDRSALRASW